MELGLRAPAHIDLESGVSFNLVTGISLPQRGQIYTIVNVRAEAEIPLFKLADLHGKELRGFFYGAELRKTAAPHADTEYRIEKIVARKTEKGHKLVLVKWAGYNKSFNR